MAGPLNPLMQTVVIELANGEMATFYGPALVREDPAPVVRRVTFSRPVARPESVDVAWLDQLRSVSR